ncbi:MAG: hypothetical protein RLZZ142_2476, partial [Verrucomicrobiota bacterium]
MPSVLRLLTPLRLLLGLCLAVAPALTPPAQAALPGKQLLAAPPAAPLLEVSMENFDLEAQGHGNFTPLRLHWINRSPGNAFRANLVVSFSLRSDWGHWHHGQLSDLSTFSTPILLPPGEHSRTFQIPLPTLQRYLHRAEIALEGPPPFDSEKVSLLTPSHQQGPFDLRPVAFAQGSANQRPQMRRVADQLLRQASSSASPPHAVTPNPLEARFTNPSALHAITRFPRTALPEFSSLPPDPRSFSQLSGVWVYAEDWNQSPTPLRLALRDWIRSGGRLFLITPPTQTPSTPPPDLPGFHGDLGLGKIASLTEKAFEDDQATKDALASLDTNPTPGHGTDYAQWSSKQTPKFTLNAPLLTGFLGVFLIVILPVNLRWIAPPDKRHRLFVSIPAFSLLATLLFTASMWFQDGGGGIGIRNGLLLLSPGETKAVFYQEQLSRTGFVNFGSFPLPEDVSFCVARTDRPDRLRLLRTPVSAEGQWFDSRARQAHLLHRWIPSRAEVVLQQAAAP